MRPYDRTMPAAAADTAPTHPCVRCGAPIPLEESLCERCNPLGLPAPASSQAHGTIFLAIVLSVIGLAVLGRLAIGGVGPFNGQVSSVQLDPPGLNVTISVHNEGSHSGATTCRVYDPTEPGIGPDSAYVLSPQVPAGASVTFSAQVTSLGMTVRTLAADCH